HHMSRRRGWSPNDVAPPTGPARTPLTRGRSSRDGFTTSTAAPPVTRTSYTPGVIGSVCATVAPAPKRSVSESSRAVPRRRSTTRTTLSLAAPVPRRQRTGSPARTTPSAGMAARGSGRSALNQSNILPHSATNASALAPPLNCHRQNPDALTTTSRRPLSDPPAIAARRSYWRARATVSASHSPVGARSDTVIGGRLSHTIPASAPAIGDGGASMAYHSPVVSADGTTSAREPVIAVRGGPK